MKVTKAFDQINTCSSIDLQYFVYLGLVNQKLDKLFQGLETQRFHLLENVKRTPQSFDLKPSQKEWSVHQVLAHLIRAEQLSIQYITKKIQGIDSVGNSGLAEEFKLIILKISQRLPFKFKAPQLIVETTPSYSDLNDLIADWDKARENLRSLLAQFEDHQLRRKIFKHIFAGRLNITQAVIFFREHVTHHTPQVNRLLKKMK